MYYFLETKVSVGVDVKFRIQYSYLWTKRALGWLAGSLSTQMHGITLPDQTTTCTNIHFDQRQEEGSK